MGAQVVAVLVRSLFALHREFERAWYVWVAEGWPDVLAADVGECLVHHLLLAAEVFAVAHRSPVDAVFVVAVELAWDGVGLLRVPAGSRVFAAHGRVDFGVRPFAGVVEVALDDVGDVVGDSLG